MKLEDLVPPFELCNQIPSDSFTDSALVWVSVLPEYEPQVLPRHNQGRIAASAPTLQEIMLAIEEEGLYCPTCYHQANRWAVDCEDDPVDEESDKRPVLHDAEDMDNPAAAALKLWLELTREK